MWRLARNSVSGFYLDLLCWASSQLRGSRNTESAHLFCNPSNNPPSQYVKTFLGNLTRCRTDLFDLPQRLHFGFLLCK